MEQNDISSRIVFADRGKVNVEKGVEFAPKFDQNGLIPALAMDHITHEPLMLAYMNAESLRMTMELGKPSTIPAAVRKSGIRALPAAMCKSKANPG